MAAKIANNSLLGKKNWRIFLFGCLKCENVTFYVQKFGRMKEIW